MEADVRKLFERYEGAFNDALRGDVDMDAVAALYAPEMIGASPAGVMTAKNDGALRTAMAQSYARYRETGTKAMQVRHVRLSPLDERHCVAHVAWRATYARKDAPDVTIDFDVHYFVQDLGDGPKVFGWVSGDELALLKAHGVG